MSHTFRRRWRRDVDPAALRAQFMRACRKVADSLCACPSGKKRYSDRVDALTALAHVRRRRPKNGRCERSAYRCRHCSGWHLSTQHPKHHFRRKPCAHS